MKVRSLKDEAEQVIVEWKRNSNSAAVDMLRLAPNLWQRNAQVALRTCADACYDANNRNLGACCSTQRLDLHSRSTVAPYLPICYRYATVIVCKDVVYLVGTLCAM